MDNITFRKIDDIKQYIEDAVERGSIRPHRYRKTAHITARPGVEGEEIITVMANGLLETKNTVKKDSMGNPGWVVTNPAGEQYIVEDSVFKNKYEKIPGTENGYSPKGNPITAGKVSENICFTAPWGEMINLVSGGFLVFTSMDDIYAIQKDEFGQTYTMILEKE